MRMTVNLQSIDGRRDMKTTVDIDESRLQLPLGDVISLSLGKVEKEIRATLGLGPKEVKKEEPKKEEPKVEVKVETPTQPAAEIKADVVAQPPAEKPAEAPPAAPAAAAETPKSGGN